MGDNVLHIIMHYGLPHIDTQTHGRFSFAMAQVFVHFCMLQFLPPASDVQHRYSLIWIDGRAVKCYQATADEIKRRIGAYDTHIPAARYKTRNKTKAERSRSCVRTENTFYRLSSSPPLFSFEIHTGIPPSDFLDVSLLPHP